MKLKLIGKFPEKTISLDTLQSLGNGQVQIQARASRKLRAFLEQCDEKLIMKGEVEK